jgi:hypothetical protein
MLKELNRDQAEFAAVLARAARAQRDSSFAGVPEADLTETTLTRGEQNPTADLGFVAVPDDAPSLMMLREVIGGRSPTRRSELYALMRVGQAQTAAKVWNRRIAEARTFGDDAITAALMDDPHLHDHLAKGLYETKQAS